MDFFRLKPKIGLTVNWINSLCSNPSILQEGVQIPWGYKLKWTSHSIFKLSTEIMTNYLGSIMAKDLTASCKSKQQIHFKK